MVWSDLVSSLLLLLLLLVIIRRPSRSDEQGEGVSEDGGEAVGFVGVREPVEGCQNDVFGAPLLAAYQFLELGDVEVEPLAGDVHQRGVGPGEGIEETVVGRRIPEGRLDAGRPQSGVVVKVFFFALLKKKLDDRRPELPDVDVFVDEPELRRIRWRRLPVVDDARHGPGHRVAHQGQQPRGPRAVAPIDDKVFPLRRKVARPQTRHARRQRLVPLRVDPLRLPLAERRPRTPAGRRQERHPRAGEAHFRKQHVRDLTEHARTRLVRRRDHHQVRRQHRRRRRRGGPRHHHRREN
mmetsp:Transcript_24160/g.77928  ORF Transcript_24160/g.77928 Transcript_24160/m.77928 type:complete len:295 (+) Transcript_24160:1-885(+)